MARYGAAFEELGRVDVAVAGGKGANLGEMTRAGLPVPPGFVVTAEAFMASMEQGGVRAELRDLAAPWWWTRPGSIHDRRRTDGMERAT